MRFLSQVLDRLGGCFALSFHGCLLRPIVLEVWYLHAGSFSALYEAFLTIPVIYRGYPESKVDENMDAEIFGLLLEEAKEAYDEEIVIELTSENSDEIESNCSRISAWVESWRKSHSEGATDA